MSLTPRYLLVADQQQEHWQACLPTGAKLPSTSCSLACYHLVYSDIYSCSAVAMLTERHAPTLYLAHAEHQRYEKVQGWC